jgi:hypothetical protein
MEKSINKIIGEYVERKDIGGLAEYFRAYIEDEITPLNDPKINGVDYENPPQSTEMEEWEKEWEEFFPQMCSIYKLHNVPRGVFMDIKSMIKSILSSHSQKLKEKIVNMVADKKIKREDLWVVDIDDFVEIINQVK